MDYRSSGVDINAGDAFATHIAGLSSPALGAKIGGFAGATPLSTGDMHEPVLLSTTDGVGTKLLVAQRSQDFATIGIDLVAMCANDLAVCGATPLQFLDYIACGSLQATPLHAIIDGVIRGCEMASCTLAGGETAEMPDVYEPGAFDLAGFCTGIVDRKDMLPRTNLCRADDILFGLPSSGIHSNGLSLARKAFANAPDADWRELLTPTRIYVTELIQLTKLSGVCAAAHITGGGLYGNISRVLPPALTVELTWGWPVPPVFSRIAQAGPVPEHEMRSVFNMGIGIALVVSRECAEDFLRLARTIHDAAGKPIEPLRIGTVVPRRDTPDERE